MPASAGSPEIPVTFAVPGSDLCLDFANTKYWRGSPSPTETLATAADLLAWATSSGASPPSLAPAIGQAWERTPPAAALAYARGIAMREAIYRVLAALAAEAVADGADLATINEALARAPARSHLVPHGDGFGWSVPHVEATEIHLLAPVLWSIGDLLTSPRRALVRCCANEKCRYVFVDDSRAGTRRWCTMSACGNRAKAKRHYARRKKD